MFSNQILHKYLLQILIYLKYSTKIIHQSRLSPMVEQTSKHVGVLG